MCLISAERRELTEARSLQATIQGEIVDAKL